MDIEKFLAQPTGALKTFQCQLVINEYFPFEEIHLYDFCKSGILNAFL